MKLFSFLLVFLLTYNLIQCIQPNSKESNEQIIRRQEKTIDDLDPTHINFDKELDKFIEYQKFIEYPMIPPRLLKMQQYLANLQNFPGPQELEQKEKVGFNIKKFEDQREKQIFMINNGLGEFKDTQNEKIKKFDQFRFSELSEKQLLQLKQRLINDQFFEVKLYNCWASSKYDINYWVNVGTQKRPQIIRNDAYGGYPCMDGIDPRGQYNRRPWYSSDLTNIEEIVTFKAETEKQTRASYLLVHWLIAPQMVSLLWSPDNKIWITDRPFAKTKSINNPNNIFGFDISFAQKIDFKEPRFLKSFKLLMSRPLAGLVIAFGSIQLFSQEFTFQIKNMNKKERCISRQSLDHYKENSVLFVMDCTEAIALNDGREIFVMTPEMEIKHYWDELCLTIGGGGGLVEGQVIQVKSCQDPMAIAQNSNKWLFKQKGEQNLFQIQSQSSEIWCLGLANHRINDDVIKLGARVRATSSLSDKLHFADKAIDGIRDNYWGSEIGDENVEYTINFNNGIKTISKIQIQWLLRPKDFAILILQASQQWITFKKIIDNEDSLTKLEFGHMYAYGIKIVMTKFDESSIINGKGAYGISNIQVFMGGYQLVLKECNTAQNQEAFWTFDQVFKVDHSQWKVRLDALDSVYDETELLIKFIAEVIQMKSTLELNIKSGKKAKALLQDIDDFSRSMEFDVEEFKRSLKMVTFKTMKQKKVQKSGYGCGVNNPARACYIIKNLNKDKKSGYYWVHPPCSPAPMRVYCDFATEAKQYYSFIQTKPLQLQNVADIETHCAKVGLEPVDLEPSSVETVINWLGDLGLDLLAKSIIPLGYDWGCQKNKCSGKFFSYNSEESEELTNDLLRQLDRENVLNKKFSIGSGIRDGIGLGMDTKKLLKFELGKFPMTGIICSANTMAGSSEPQVIGITCDEKVWINFIFQFLLYKLLLKFQVAVIQYKIYSEYFLILSNIQYVLYFINLFLIKIIFFNIYVINDFYFVKFF